MTTNGFIGKCFMLPVIKMCLIYGKSDLIENHVFRIIADIL